MFSPYRFLIYSIGFIIVPYITNSLWTVHDHLYRTFLYILFIQALATVCCPYVLKTQNIPQYNRNVVKFLFLLFLLFMYLSWLFNVPVLSFRSLFSPPFFVTVGWYTCHILTTLYPIAQLLAYQYEQNQRLQNRTDVSLLYTLLAIHNYPTLECYYALPFRRCWSKRSSSSSSSLSSVTLPISFILLPAYGSLIGTWVGGFAIPLDWDVPWKYWPICNLYGYVGGLLLGEFGSFWVGFLDRSN